MIDVLFGILIAMIAGYMTSFPPSVHSVVVKSYDYPVTRILLFTSVLLLALYAPVAATIYGIGVAILSEDILKSSQHTNQTESFQTSTQKDLQKSLKIQVAKQMSPIEEALEKVKHAEHLLRQNISSKKD